MEKIDKKLRALVAPSLVVVASAYDENGKADACTLAFVAMTSHVPPCLTIAINATQRRRTLKSILASGSFVVHFPSIHQVREADYLGVESGENTDKLKNLGYTTVKGREVNAPIINEFPLALECEVVNTVTIGSHTQITGEIKNIQANEDILNEKGNVMMSKLNPIIYNEEEMTYHQVGDVIGPAFKMGIEMKRELN